MMTADPAPAPAPPANPSRPRVSAVVICGNEEHNIGDCLESVAWCDEVVVVDSMSTDRTPEIARRFTERLIRRPWPGYVAQKNFALEQATGDWVLSLDADERCTPELRARIESALAAPGDAVAFRVRRKVRYLGRWIRHCGWYPDRKVRLVRRGLGRWEGEDPHDRLETAGPVRDLDADLVHYTYRDFSHQIRTINHFSDVAVAEWRKKGKGFSLLMLLLHPVVKFFEVYVRKLGVLDGFAGLVIAISTSFYVFTKHVKHWEAQNGLPERRPT
jgi:glycosyltransferase involved in cell wall biosynthesis